MTGLFKTWVAIEQLCAWVWIPSEQDCITEIKNLLCSKSTKYTVLWRKMQNV